MKGSKERIIEYTKALGHLKEKVFAVALLFAVSVIMMVSVSFAWLALSNNPEVSGVTTSIAGNGNLEIALVEGELSSVTTPDESKIGDSDKELLMRNITWGNLINLSDPAYGLDNLILRPARLNESSLDISPLYGAEYTEDGRISKLNSNFSFATWKPSDVPGLPGEFVLSNKLGVRAITSTKTAESNTYQYYLQVEKEYAEGLNLEAGNMYLAITGDAAYMEALAYIMGTYMTSNMNQGQGDVNLTNPTVDKEHMETLRDMFAAFINVMNKEADALAALANLQLYIKNGGYNEANPYVQYTAESLIADVNNLNSKGIHISNFSQFISDLETLKLNHQKLVDICNLGTIKWEDQDIKSIINSLVNVGSCTVDGTKVSSIGASAALNLNNKSCETIITNGILQRFEQRTGIKMYVGPEYNGGKGLLVTAKGKRLGMTMDGKIYAKISTDATAPFLFPTDIANALSKNTGGTAVLQANDTFGLAVDLWVRTNQPNSYLTLQGNVLTKTEEVRSKGISKNGDEVELYTIEYTVEIENENGDKEVVDVTDDLYKIEEDGVEKWYRLSSHAEVTTEELNGKTPLPKYEEVVTVIGYEGDNRVWDGSVGLSVNSTTQGSGSCYVYYADSPEDQARSLELLKYLNVAFVNEKQLLATAVMDTERFYADNGKVIVPLVLRSDSINLGEDYTGITKYAITALEKNVPTRITAIVYLDGTDLHNDDVLAAADIQGQLNIQFGTADALIPIKNESLMNKEIVVSASVSKNSFNYDESSSDKPMTTVVSINVSGAQPKSVTAFFIRSINSSQGSREIPMTFLPVEGVEGQWTSEYTFSYPGNYILRSVRLDGVEYDLSDRPVVTVSGFTIKSVTWAEESNYTSIMTAGRSESIELNVEFASNDPNKMPKTVQGRFLREEDGTVASINFTYNTVTNIWTGNATFVTSGEYTLQYLLLNGEYVELAENMRKHVSVYLGMKVRIYTDSPIDFKLVPSQMTENMKNLKMNVVIEDDTDKEMTYLDATKEVKLTYRLNTSNAKKTEIPLTWNPMTNYYEGTFHSMSFGPGIFIFDKVSVGEDNIINALTSPKFTIRSPEPPSYYRCDVSENQFAPNQNAMFNVDIAYSSTAKASATIAQTNDNGDIIKLYENIVGVMGTDFEGENGVPVNTWLFTIPTASSGTQDGYWKLISVNVWDVPDAQGVYYTQDNPLVFNLSEHNISTRVVATVNIIFASGQDKEFNGAFMATHTISGITVDIYDFEGKAIAGIANVKLKYTYGGESRQYGGYTSDAIEFDDKDVILASDDSGIKFTQTEAFNVQYAGTYTPIEFSFNVVGAAPFIYTKDNENMPDNVPSFTVSSTVPSATITAISPTGTFDVDKSGIGSGHASSTVPAWDGTNATVYFKCNRSGSGSTCDPYRHNYARPSVTIKLAGIGQATQAELSFGSGVHIYNGTTQTTGYTWTADGACSRNIGYYRSRTAANDDKTAAGTLTANTLVLKYEGDAFNFAIPTITIYNPY